MTALEMRSPDIYATADGYMLPASYGEALSLTREDGRPMHRISTSADDTRIVVAGMAHAPLAIEDAVGLWYELTALIRAAQDMRSPSHAPVTIGTFTFTHAMGMSLRQFAAVIGGDVDQAAAILLGVDRLRLVQGFALDDPESDIEWIDHYLAAKQSIATSGAEG